MKSTRSVEDFPHNSESDVWGASFSDDDDISEASDDVPNKLIKNT
jgi:hypothetical protein